MARVLGQNFCQGQQPTNPCERNSKQSGHTSTALSKSCANLIIDLRDLYSGQDQLQPATSQVNRTMIIHITCSYRQTGIVFIQHTKADAHTLYIRPKPEDRSAF